MKKSVIVLNLPGNYLREECCFYHNRNRKTPPVLLSMIATHLQKDHKVSLVDADLFGWDYDDVESHIRLNRPDMLITSIVYCFPKDKKIIEICELLEVPLVICPIPFSYGDELVKQNQVDNLIDVPDISQLDTISYNLLPPLELYNTLIYQVGQGCPHSCVFCMWANTPYKLRPVSVLIEDLNSLYRRGVRQVFLLCSQITTNKRWLEEFCKQKIRSQNPILWHTDIRAPDLTPVMASLMYKAGCYAVFMGLESPVPRILKQMRKNIKPSDVVRAIQICLKVGIIPKFSLMFNFGETEKDIEHYMRFISQPSVRLAIVRTTNLFVIPGTNLDNPKFKYIDTGLIQVFRRRLRSQKPLRVVSRVLWLLTNKKALNNFICFLKTRKFDTFLFYLIHLLGVSS